MIVIDNFFSKIKIIFHSKLIDVIGDTIGFKCLATNYVGVFIADKIGRNLGVLLTTVLCTVGLRYKMPGVVPTGEILSNYFPATFSSF